MVGFERYESAISNRIHNQLFSTLNTNMPKHADLPQKIDNKYLTLIYKKNGSFDKQRKRLLENFKTSQTHSNLLLKLKLMVESKVKADPSLLLKNKGKMAALIQGEIISNNSGSNILDIVDKDIQEKIIDSPEFHNKLKVELKDIRRKALGISDEDYVKQLEEEARVEKEEAEKKQREQAEKELAYKNNFKVKQLAAPPRQARPPRFNLPTRERDSYRGRASSGRHTDRYERPGSNLQWSHDDRNGKPSTGHMMY